MAAEDKKDVFEEGVAKSQADGELFASEAPSFVDSPGLAAPEELSAHDVFVGDEDFYKLLEESSEVSAAQSSVARDSYMTGITRQGRFTVVQKVLAISIVGVVLLLVYLLVNYPSGGAKGPASASGSEAAPKIQQPPPIETTTVEPVSAQAEHVNEQVQESEPVLDSTDPVSLEVARGFFQQKDYEGARAAYNQLRQTLPAREEHHGPKWKCTVPIVLSRRKLRKTLRIGEFRLLMR